MKCHVELISTITKMRNFIYAKKRYKWTWKGWTRINDTRQAVNKPDHNEPQQEKNEMTHKTWSNDKKEQNEKHKLCQSPKQFNLNKLKRKKNELKRPEKR